MLTVYLVYLLALCSDHIPDLDVKWNCKITVTASRDI